MVCGGLRSPGSYSGTVALTTRIRACAYATPRVHHVASTAPVAFATLTFVRYCKRFATSTVTVRWNRHRRRYHRLAGVPQSQSQLSFIILLAAIVLFFAVIVSAVVHHHQYPTSPIPLSNNHHQHYYRVKLYRL